MDDFRTLFCKISPNIYKVKQAPQAPKAGPLRSAYTWEQSVAGTVGAGTAARVTYLTGASCMVMQLSAYACTVTDISPAAALHAYTRVDPRCNPYVLKSEQKLATGRRRTATKVRCKSARTPTGVPSPENASRKCPLRHTSTKPAN